MFPAAFTLLLLGLVLYLLGRRGTTASSYPFCARCGRNLHMLSVETDRCPDCGADIRQPDAITLGHRQPLRAPMIVGLLTCLGGIALLVLAIILWWPTFDGSPLKPTSMLLVELTDPAHTARAARELGRRLHANALADADTTRLADLILKLQSSPAKPWNPAYGDVLQAAQASHHLPPDKWQTYLQQALQLSARIRPRATAGDPIPVQLTCRLKAGTQYTALLPATLSPRLSVTLHNETTPLPLGQFRLDSIPTAQTWTTLCLPTATIAPGPQAVTLHASLTLTDAHTSATGAQTFSFHLEILPPDQSSVTAVPPATDAAERDFRAALHWRLHGTDDTAPRAATSMAVLLDDSHTLGYLFISAPPIAASFRIVLRQDEREWPLARLLVPPDDATTVPLSLPTNPLAPQPHAGPAELVCLPDPSPAAATLDIQQIYGAEVHQPITLLPRQPAP
jgi:hypothetical protein